MKTLLIIDHDTRTCRFYINCATKREAKDRGMKVDGDLLKFESKQDAEKAASDYTNGFGYGANYTQL